MSNITTVIFDVYETLAHNNVGLWMETFRGICRTQHLPMDAEQLWRHWKALEMNFRQERLNLQEPDKPPPFKSYEEAWRGCFQVVFHQCQLPGDAAAAARAAVEDMGLRKAYPDAVEAIPGVQARWRTGILSNADDDYLNPTLERLGYQFEAVLSSETARAYKPHPAPFHRIMEMLGVVAGECVYVGDNQFDDVQGANGVGMRTVWVNRNGSPLDPKLPVPDYQVRDLTELPQILER